MLEKSLSTRTLPAAERRICAFCEARGLALCGALDVADLGQLETATTSVRVEPPKGVIFEDDPARHTFILKSGTLRLTKTLADGRRQVTGFLFAGAFVGLGHGETYAYSAEAVTPSVLCRIDRDRLVALMKDLPELQERLLSIASEEIKRGQDHALLLGRKTARERIACFLILLAREAERRGQNPTPIELPMSRVDIADYLGLTIETVSRTFTQLVRAGAIDLPSPHHVECRDLERLDDIAAGRDSDK